jgi:hypothetical protein
VVLGFVACVQFFGRENRAIKSQGSKAGERGGLTAGYAEDHGEESIGRKESIIVKLTKKFTVVIAFVIRVRFFGRENRVIKSQGSKAGERGGLTAVCAKDRGEESIDAKNLLSSN